MRDRRLQCVEAVVERQQGMPPEGDHDRLLFNGQDGIVNLSERRAEERRFF
jgi:hypothetical protein